MSSTSATPPTGAPEANGPKEYYINFNQDCTSLSVGSKSGYRLFSLNNVETLEQIYSGPDDAYIVERLFCSSLVAIVTLSIPRKLRVCHFKKGTEICNYSYSNAILGVKLNRARLVVCLEGSLYIHNIRDMKVLHTIRDTPPNHRGLCALSISSDNCFIAYPGSLMIGQIQIFDAVNLSSKTEIKAHDSQLAALGFSPDGTRVASASEKGTVIRVFSVENSTKLYEFRRGVKRCVAISCLKFSLCGQFLACSSNTATIHIFKMDEPKESPHQPAEDNSWMGYFSNYLPSKVTDVLTQGRAFATAYLPVSGGRNVIAITTIQQKLRLLIAMEDGRLLIYNINTNEGGDLTLVEEHQLAEEVVESAAVTVDGPKNTSPKMVEGGILGSYAGIVKGNPMGQMSGTESEKLREMAAAIESPSPPKDSSFQFTDKQEYPPLTQNSE